MIDPSESFKKCKISLEERQISEKNDEEEDRQANKSPLVKIKQGQQSDLPEEPKILTQSRRKSCLGSSKRKNSINQFFTKSIKIFEHNESSNKQEIFSTSEKQGQRSSFYDYCGSQIMNLANTNRDLQELLKEMQQQICEEDKKNKLLGVLVGDKSREIEELNKIDEMKCEQMQELKERIQKLSKIQKRKKLNKKSMQNIVDESKDPIFQAYQQKQLRNLQKIKDLKGLKQKIERINRLTSEKEGKSKSVAQLLDNISRVELETKQMNESDTTRHLWDVKTIQYENLLNMIKNT